MYKFLPENAAVWLPGLWKYDSHVRRKVTSTWVYCFTHFHSRIGEFIDTCVFTVKLLRLGLISTLSHVEEEEPGIIIVEEEDTGRLSRNWVVLTNTLIFLAYVFEKDDSDQGKNRLRICL